MEIQGEAVLTLDLAIYNNATEGEKYADMSCMDTSVNVTLGCIRLVFVNKFVNDLLVSISQKFSKKLVNLLTTVVGGVWPNAWNLLTVLLNLCLIFSNFQFPKSIL